MDAHPCEESFDAVGAALAAVFDHDPAVTGLAVHNEGAVMHVTTLPLLGRAVPDATLLVPTLTTRRSSAAPPGSAGP
jgi:hypothetical protein